MFREKQKTAKNVKIIRQIRKKTKQVNPDVNFKHECNVMGGIIVFYTCTYFSLNFSLDLTKYFID